MKKSDYAHRMTDAELAKLERRISAIYEDAAQELTDTVKAYFEQFEKRDAAMKEKLEAGEITDQYYKQWRLAQMGRGKRFTALRDKVAERYTDANATAVAYVNDATPGIYSLNRNYAAYKIEQVSNSADFTLWDEQTVKRLAVKQPDLMPYYPPKRALQRGIDLKYGKQQITASVTSSILQGKSIPHIADDLQNHIQGMSRASAIRTARTAVTGAQNAGRMDTYAAAEAMGISLKKRWLATLDGRTRHSHAMLDGETIPNDETFSNGCRFPGDPQGTPAEVYNCRCTLIADIDDDDTSIGVRRAIDPETGESVLVKDMTYAEWAGWKKDKKQVASSERFAIIKEKDKPISYRQFDTGDAANDFFYYDGEERGLLAKKKSEHAKWQKSLTENEKIAIEDYTGGGYYDINEYLRKTGDWENINAKLIENKIAGLDSAISKYSLKDNIRVQRGVMDDVLDDLIKKYGDDEAQLIGKIYKDSAYMSTTVLRDNRVAISKPVVLDIEIPAGTGRGAYVNQLAGQYQDSEYEFLLARGSEFQITGIEENESMIPPQIVIKMRLLSNE